MSGDEYTEVGGVMWCTQHEGIADELNNGDECDQADVDDVECHLVALYWKSTGADDA